MCQQNVFFVEHFFQRLGLDLDKEKKKIFLFQKIERIKSRLKKKDKKRLKMTVNN